MLFGYAVAEGKLQPLQDVAATIDRAGWIDVLNPTPEEEATLEAALGIDIPTREDMREIETSSRLYVDEGAVFMTAMIPAQTDGDAPIIAPVTFILSGSRLITVRYEQPRAFETFPVRAQKAAVCGASADSILTGLLEAVVERLADVLEKIAADTDDLSAEVFCPPEKKPTRSLGFRRIVVRVGRNGDLNSKIRESLVTLERMLGFAILHIDERARAPEGEARKNDKELRARLKTLSRDVHALTEHVGYLSQKIGFLLEATLGMVNIEQNAIIKTFSVVAVAFLPPTLIASIYGMNFDFMPELHWALGYPFSIVLMILSALGPLAYFKNKGWL